MEGPLPASLSEAFERDLDWVLRNTGTPGITAAVGLPGQGLWTATRGVNNDSARTPLAAPALFHWASVGKAWTATLVAQLQEEGRLSLQAPVSTWFPHFPNAANITIDHLLTHRSGIYSYQADPAYRATRGYQSPDQAIEIAARHGNEFCPGQYWSYSNTGYGMLGRIIEAIEGAPFDEVLRRRLIVPAGLGATFALAPGQTIAGTATISDDFVPSNPYSAGNIVATAADMTRWWHALMAGRFVRSDTIDRALADLYPMVAEPSPDQISSSAAQAYYGRGLMVYVFENADGEKQEWIGHGGGTPGLKTLVIYDVRSRAIVSVALNSDVSPLAVANKLLSTLKAHRQT